MGKNSKSRSLHWERGLKLTILSQSDISTMSLPSLGAWIETTLLLIIANNSGVAPFIGSVD